MPYAIEFAPPAAKQFRKLRGDIGDRVAARVDALALDPRPHGVEKLAGADNLYRVRVGDFRIVYEIHDRRLIVLVVRIADRKEAHPPPRTPHAASEPRESHERRAATIPVTRRLRYLGALPPSPSGRGQG